MDLVGLPNLPSRASTPPQKNARNAREKLADAVRILLECIGEDPDRDGLRRTPERYANALMWLTRGYEERLAGEPSHRTLFFNLAPER